MTEELPPAGDDVPGTPLLPGAAQRWSLLAIGVLVGALFLYLAVRNVDMAEVAGALAAMQLIWLAPLTCVYLLNLGMRIWRWQLMFPEQERPSKRFTADVFFIGKLGNNVMPGRLGEVLRAAAFGKLLPGIGFSGAITTIVIEKTLDAIGVAVLFGIALLIVPMPQWAFNAGVGLAMLCPVLLLAMIFADRIRAAISMRAGNSAPRGYLAILTEKVRGMLAKYSLGLHSLRSSRTFSLLVGMTLLIWCIEVVVFFICLQMFSIDAPAAAAIVAVVLLVMGSMLPAAPGFIGTYQFFIVAALGLYGVAEPSAFALAVFLNLYVILLTTVIGVIALVSEGGAIEVSKLLGSARVQA